VTRAVLRGFAPVARPDARVLVLGSMPGTASLASGEYYAHPQNAFWFVQGALFGAGPELSYSARLTRLNEVGVALWDVLNACARVGSLDSAITPDSERANDFETFFAAHPRIAQVFFNGAKAESAWRRHVARQLVARQLVARAPTLVFARLPSTSPAHASLNRAQKLSAWRAVAACVR